MFHDVRLDERQGRAGLVGEDVSRPYQRRLVGKQDLETRVVIAEERLALDITFVAGDDAGSFLAGERLICFLEHQQAGALCGGRKSECRLRWKEGIAAGGSWDFLPPSCALQLPERT